MNKRFKRLIAYVAITMLMVLTTSCENGDHSSSNYLAVKQQNDELWSMLKPNGEFLFENEFKQNISDAVEGLFLVPEENMKTLYKATPIPTPLNNYSNLLDVGEPSEGKVVIIDRDSKITTIKTNGDILFSLPPDIITCHASFKNGLLGVCNEKAQWGYVNEKGEQVIPCKYITVTPFSEGHAIVAEYRNDRIKLSLIDKSGNITAVVNSYLYLIPSSTEFHNGRIPVVNIDKQFGFLTVDGIFEKCSFKVTGIKDVTDYGFIFQNAGGRCGAMDYKGDILVQPRYDDLMFIPGSRNYIAKIQNRYSELDDKGEKILDFTDYKTVTSGTKDFPIIASTGKRFELLNSNGKTITKNDFAEINTKIGFSKDILNPSNTDLFNFNFEMANYLDQVFQGFKNVNSLFQNEMDTISDTNHEVIEIPAEDILLYDTINNVMEEANIEVTGNNDEFSASISIQNSTDEKENNTGVRGNYNFGFAIFTGQLKNGKPNGRGKMVFSARYSDNVRNYTAEAGDYIEGNFTNGALDNGSLYKKDGSKVKTIY